MIIGRSFFITIFILLLIGGIIVFELPFLYEEEIPQYDVYINSGNIAVISDLHLDSNSRDLTSIGNYLKDNEIDYLIINGDLFDKMHNKKFNPNFLKDAMERLDVNQSTGLEKVIYIPALYNHDPYLDEVSEFDINGLEFLVLKGALRLNALNTTFYIMHGDYVIRDGVFAGLISILTPGLFYEKMARDVINAGKQSWVILGHSHVSGIDPKEKLGNTGCWISRILPSSDTVFLIKINKKLDISLVKVLTK